MPTLDIWDNIKLYSLIMEGNMQGLFIMEKEMVMEHFITKMEVFMKDNGKII